MSEEKSTERMNQYISTCKADQLPTIVKKYLEIKNRIGDTDVREWVRQEDYYGYYRPVVKYKVFEIDLHEIVNLLFKYWIDKDNAFDAQVDKDEKLRNALIVLEDRKKDYDEWNKYKHRVDILWLFFILGIVITFIIGMIYLFFKA